MKPEPSRCTGAALFFVRLDGKSAIWHDETTKMMLP